MALNQFHSRKVYMQYYDWKQNHNIAIVSQFGIIGAWYFNENDWKDLCCTFALLTVLIVLHLDLQLAELQLK